MLTERRVKSFSPQNTAGVSQKKASQYFPKQLKQMVTKFQTLKKKQPLCCVQHTWTQHNICDVFLKQLGMLGLQDTWITSDKQIGGILWFY